MPVSTTATPFLPDAFLAQMRELLPDDNDFQAFINISHQPLRRSLRVNTLKISVTQFTEQMARHGWQLTPVPWCDEGFWISRDEDHFPLGSSAEHLSGLFYIQEASSMLPVTALFAATERPERVLDMAAAPGSKTTQIAARMQRHGAIVANEYAASRLKVLHANLSRCGVSHVALSHFDGRVFGAALPEQFDAILLDAPCSGEGVLRKDADALKNWSPDSNIKIAATQRELIRSAFHALKPGGVLVYSTCTLNHTENQQVIDWLLAQWPQAAERLPLNTLFDGAERVATAAGDLHVFPQRFDSEGFFVARLRKTASVTPPPAPSYQPGKLPFSRLSAAKSQQVITAAGQVGLRWHDLTLSLWQRDNELWLFPQAVEPLLGKIRFSRIGLRLAETHNKGYRWQHEAVIALADPGAHNRLALTCEEAEEWYRGRDIYPSAEIKTQEVIVTFQQQVLGLAKKVGNRLKNSYPRELVRDGKLFNQHQR
ncbi:16S rRNA (cytosine(1407)-C(5))-methyltransferase RsmF [Erwinia sp. OLTSP20]|uniref:16S rRNA (cytosine(1407)-C(5))-methyltransferase RsmF n=1 Tax=unclassified Erwinia TaxID=2622719 RepID=UPI000C18305B|nr:MULTISPECIES: 16S rRNA (cytosine(1407)-C(5))-methyltransferase RsmF [unclassified Erwinia]PIJ51442.1 16S rRNA (cytosine(1407)-C(5))-methyltransferase RsmF [Erwinia sp. OAMSP11]PIJ73464.1 16S rRNA (cytosine(1407)-C(5))-methyltransferase RsmF [Erwinia sp. OLSSP12]PIJ85527.1 16S rRNA (cytosine(1407)-C(5))-methyltransferase RsmF [Erwinia sp. OLCASP19]PIJ85925.1 16S rRNA (cytosine(1407)-C(5))-methyltransferase RsmF [Erwinia sp. OLMTSP26]PIJ87406.1 16S rRNA (cytosine(1407)-C(5))-methyltransferase